jgi:glycosyltransferase involved in cell wall biosynthesis
VACSIGSKGVDVRFSVVISTRDRADLVPRAINSVLAQRAVDFELIVVDDGSRDDTPKVLAGFDDQRLRVIRRANGGPAAARNTGIAAASGEWTVFLDDDDVALPGWLERFAELIGPGVGVVCCAAEVVTPDGTLIDVFRPNPQGPLFEHVTGLFIAGAFAMEIGVLREIGGYDERLISSEQFDLAIRLVPVLAKRGWEIRNIAQPGLRVERRPPAERPMTSPAAQYHSIRVLLQSHSEHFTRDRHYLAGVNSVLGVSAAQLERWSEARLALLASARVNPLSVRPWLRLAIACVPPLGRRVWRLQS